MCGWIDHDGLRNRARRLRLLLSHRLLLLLHNRLLHWSLLLLLNSLLRLTLLLRLLDDRLLLNLLRLLLLHGLLNDWLLLLWLLLNDRLLLDGLRLRLSRLLEDGLLHRWRSLVGRLLRLLAQHESLVGSALCAGSKREATAQQRAKGCKPHRQSRSPFIKPRLILPAHPFLSRVCGMLSDRIV